MSWENIKSSILWLLLFLFLPAIIAVAVMIGITPIHIRVVHEAGTQTLPVLSVSGVTRAYPSVAVSELRNVELTVLKAPVSVLPPRIPRGPYYSQSDFSSFDGWQETRSWPPEYTALQPGAKLVVMGWRGDIGFQFKTGPDQGSIQTAANNDVKTIDLAASEVGALDVNFAATTRALIATTPFLFRNLELVIENATPVIEVEVKIGLLEVTTFKVPTGSSRLDLVVENSQLLAALTPGLNAVLKVLTIACIIALSSAIFGFGIVGVSGLTLSKGERWLITIFSGATAFSAITASFAFVMPTRWAAIISVVLLAGFSLVRFLSHGLSDQKPLVHRLPVPALVVAGGVAATIMGIWPIVLSNGWFAGMLQTDAYDYGSLANQFANQSVIDASLHFGFGLRYADMIPAAALTALFGGPGIQMFQPLMLFWIAGMGVFASMLARRLGANEWGILAVGLLATCASSLLGLYVESYFTRFVFTAVFALLALPAVVALDGMKDGQLPFWQRLRLWLPFISGSAFAVSLVPYFSFFLPAAAVAIFYQERGHLWRTVSITIAFGLAILALANVSLWFLAYPEVALNYSVGVDALARGTIFPYHDQPRFLALIWGLTPKNWNLDIATALAGEAAQGDWIFSVYQFLFDFLNSLPVLLFILALVVFLLIEGLKPKKQPLAAGVVFVIACLGIALAAAVTLVVLSKHIYATLSLLWTIGALSSLLGIPMLVVAITNMLKTSGWRRGAAWFGVVLVAALIPINLMSRLADVSGWYAHPDGSATAGHSRIASDVAALSGFVESSSFPIGATAATISGRHDDLLRSDSERVLYNLIAQIFAAKGISCSNCQISPFSGSVSGIEKLTLCPADPKTIIVQIGAFDELCPARKQHEISDQLLVIK